MDILIRIYAICFAKDPARTLFAGLGFIPAAGDALKQSDHIPKLMKHGSKPVDALAGGMKKLIDKVPAGIRKRAGDMWTGAKQKAGDMWTSGKEKTTEAKDWLISKFTKGDSKANTKGTSGATPSKYTQGSPTQNQGFSNKGYNPKPAERSLSKTEWKQTHRQARLEKQGKYETPVNSGKSAPKDKSVPNSIYEQLAPDGTVRKREFYDANGNQFNRQDFDHTHFNKKTKQYHQPHEHTYNYNNKGQPAGKTDGPLKSGYNNKQTK